MNGNDGHKDGADHFDLVVECDAEPVDLRPLARLLLSLAGHQLPGADSPQRDRDVCGLEQPGMPDTTTDKRKDKGRTSA